VELGGRKESAISGTVTRTDSLNKDPREEVSGPAEREFSRGSHNCKEGPEWGCAAPVAR
jgi:hypothetical protein